MNQEDAINRLEYLYTYRPFELNRDEEFEICELCKQLYEETGNIRFLELADSTGFITNKKYLLNEYIKAVDNGIEQFAYEVGCLYYKGELGYADYEKAFRYFMIASKTEKLGDGSFVNSDKEVANDAKYYLAIMYKNGLGVEKNHEEYERLMNELYTTFMNMKWYEDTDADMILEIGNMLLEDGDVFRYCDLLLSSREHQGIWIRLYNTNVEQLKKINDSLYKTILLDLTELTPLDITELVKIPGIIRFRYDNKIYEIEVLDTEDGMIIDYDNGYYKDVNDLICNGQIGESFFHEAMFETYGWEVVE